MICIVKEMILCATHGNYSMVFMGIYMELSSWLFFFFKFYFIFKLYITVLDLPNIKMNPPQVYMCSPS